MENGSGISDKHAEELRQGLAAALAAQEAQRKQAKEAQEKAEAAQAAQIKFAQEVLAKAAAAKGEAPVQIAAAPSVSGSATAAPTASASDSKAEAPSTVSVGKGDSLWKIAKARSGGENVVAYMAALAEKNEAVLGSGIGKLKVGMKLELPTEEELASVGKVKVAEMGEQLAAAQKAAAEKAQRRQAELAARQSHRNESVASAPEASAPAVQASASAAPAGSDAKAPAEPGLVEKAKSAASHAFEAVQGKASAAASGVKAWHEENSKAYREKMLADAAGYEKSGIPRDLMPSDVQAALAEAEREKSAAAKPAVQASAAAPQAPSGSDAKPEAEGPGLFDRIKGKLSAAADGVAAWHEENAKAYREGKLKEAEEYRKVGFGPDKMPEDVRKVLDEVARENEAKSKVGGVNWAARGARPGADHEEPQQAPTPKR